MPMSEPQPLFREALHSFTHCKLQPLGWPLTWEHLIHPWGCKFSSMLKKKDLHSTVVIEPTSHCFQGRERWQNGDHGLTGHHGRYWPQNPNKHLCFSTTGDSTLSQQTNKQTNKIYVYIYIYYVIINNLFLKIFKVDYVNFYVVQILHFSPLLGTRQSFNQMYVISVGCA